jgi:hypothetical protein
MNDPKILAARLDDLAKLASIAETDFEKAAIYAATRAIVAQFDEVEDEFDEYLLEKLTAGAWHINAAIGYDIDNGHDRSHHVSAAYGQISTLKSLLSKRE